MVGPHVIMRSSIAISSLAELTANVERAVQRVGKVDLQRQRHLGGGTTADGNVGVVAALSYVRVHLVVVCVRIVAPVREPRHPDVLVAVAVGGDVCPIVLWAAQVWWGEVWV